MIRLFGVWFFWLVFLVGVFGMGRGGMLFILEGEFFLFFFSFGVFWEETDGRICRFEKELESLRKEVAECTSTHHHHQSSNKSHSDTNVDIRVVTVETTLPSSHSLSPSPSPEINPSPISFPPHQPEMEMEELSLGSNMIDGPKEKRILELESKVKELMGEIERLRVNSAVC